MTAQRVGRVPTVLQRRVADVTILYNPATDEMHTLDAIGSAIWDHLDSAEPIAQADVVAALAARYGAAPGDIGSDIDALLTTLSSAGLVERDG